MYPVDSSSFSTDDSCLLTQMRPDTALRRLIFESANQTKAIVLRTTTEKDNKKTEAQSKQYGC